MSKGGLTAKEFQVRLRERCSGKGYLYFSELRSSPGYGAATYADGLSFCLWPSRGFELHGYEIKVARSDWLAELKRPEKADNIARYCDRWSLVANKGIVQNGELPRGWGLLVPAGSGLRAQVKAELREPEPIGRGFFASLLSRMVEYSPSAELLAEAERRGEVNAKAAAESKLKGQLEFCQRRRDEAEKAIEDFQKASGLYITQYTGGKIGEAMMALREHAALEQKAKDMRDAAKDFLREAKDLRSAAVALEKYQFTAESEGGNERD